MTVLNKEMKENNRVELTIRVEKPEWQKALDDAYQANRDLYPVDGCAPGKATRQALEQAYAPDVFYQEAVNETFPRALVEAFGQEEILVAGAPELRIVDIGPEGFTFAALAELYPEVKLGKYKGLAAPMPQAELSNDDVDKAESEWLQAHLVEEERDRAAMGDEVTLDFDGSVDGVPFDGGKAENYPLLLGSGMFIDGFEEQVAGIRPEEEREIHVTFPQQYTPELAGKAAVFRVQAHRIVRRSMPELNDEFARAQGFSDAAALRAMYTDEQICALLGVPEASDEEIERARARIERKRRKDQLTSGLCACIMIVAIIAGLVMLFVPEYETPYFWLAWAIGGLLCAVAAIAVGSFVKDQPSR